MDWDELGRHIPWISGAGRRLYEEKTPVYDGEGWMVAVSQPGKEWNRTTPPGGDFAIRIHAPADVSPTGRSWEARTFTHIDLFLDVEAKTRFDSGFARETVGRGLAAIVRGEDPMGLTLRRPGAPPGLPIRALLCASQCLALCEHRRYKKFEPLGGRYLPARFALGIVFDLWTAGQAADVVWDGRRGLERLRAAVGRSEPALEEVL